MREDFLHYLWRLARFDLRRLTTTEGEPISIQNFGIYNKDAGPDFSAARISISGIEWAGQVEMHLRSSEWYDHRHEEDAAYENVILHVVLEEDRPVYRKNGERIPCLELKGRIPPKLINSYWRLMHNEYWISCQHQLASVSPLVVSNWISRLSVERLERQCQLFKAQLEQCDRDWETVFYRSIARSLGGKVNADAMEVLARSIPLRVLLKHKHSLLQLEALLFGQAGLIPEDSEDEYPQLLKREYTLLAQKYQLKQLPKAIWRYLRLRPANFPTIRIAQLARLINTSGQLFNKALAAANIQELEQMFAVELSNYWREHYLFDKPVQRSRRKLGRSSIHSILINTVIPLLLLYGQLRGDDKYEEKAMRFLNDLPAEKNVILKNWAKLDQKPQNAADSQSLLELHRYYCSRKRCMDCAIGCAILKDGKSNSPVLSVNEETLLYGYGLVV